MVINKTKETIAKRTKRLISEKEISDKKAKKDKIVEAIKKVYSTDEEFKLINLGIANPQDPKYIEYRKNITKIKESANG